jgi:hypothetical protein
MFSFIKSKPTCAINVELIDEKQRKKVRVHNEMVNIVDQMIYAYRSDEPVSGHVKIKCNKGINHVGVQAVFIGEIVLLLSPNDDTNFNSDISSVKKHSRQFVRCVQQIAPSGFIPKFDNTNDIILFFHFQAEESKRVFESYYGKLSVCRYFIEIRILLPSKSKKLSNNLLDNNPSITHRIELFVTCKNDPNLLMLSPLHENPEFVENDAPIVANIVQENKQITMEVGLGNDLHIVMKFYKTLYHLNDVVLGKITFIRSILKLKRMELMIIRREQVYKKEESDPNIDTSADSGADNIKNEKSEVLNVSNDTISKFEIMDGDPPKNQMIPVRIYLSGINTLTPTYDISGLFSVKYFLNVCLIDDNDRRLFKQQEIHIYRKEWSNWQQH